MPIFHANPGRFSWWNPNTNLSGSFAPRGSMDFHGAHPNPIREKEKNVYAARFFVGFSVGLDPSAGMNDLIRIVKRVRTEQVNDPAASFVAQRGLYKYEESGADVVVEEDGAQVIIFNTPKHKTPYKLFEKHMEAIGDAIRVELQQETVILEMQKNGVSLFTGWVMK